MKKTLLITLEYPPNVGGVANYYLHLVESLPGVRVLDNAQHLLLYQLLWPRWLQGIWSTWKVVRREQIECLLVGQILPLGTVAMIINRVLGVPYIVMTHAMDITQPFSSEGKSRKRWLIKRILQHASAVTTVSEYTKQKLMELGVPAERIAFVYPCPHITPERFPVTEQQLNELNRRYELEGKRVMFSVGRLVERKGFDTTIDAMKQVHAQHPNVRYIIAGNGPYAYELKKRVEADQLQGVVEFVGAVSDEQLAVWYTRCDLFAMPSRALKNQDVEGFGIVYLEANSFGKPVIGGKSGGVADAVVHEQTGFLVDPHSVDEVAAAINRLLTDESVRTRLGDYGRRRVNEQFQWKTQAQTLETVINTL